MKTIKISFFLIFMASFGFAQTSESNILAGGEVYIDFTGEKQKAGNTKSDLSNTFSIDFRPKVGYFFMDGLAAGLEINYQTSSTKFEGRDEKLTTHALGIGPFARYYMENGLFGELFIGVGSSKIEDALFGEMKSSLFGYRLGVGYALFLGDHIALEPSIMYDHETQKPKDSDIDTKDILSVIEIGLGFKAYIDYK